MHALVEGVARQAYNQKLLPPLSDFNDQLRIDFSRGITVRTATSSGIIGNFHMIPPDGELDIPLLPTRRQTDHDRKCCRENASHYVVIAGVPFQNCPDDVILQRQLSFVDSSLALVKHKQNDLPLCKYMHSKYFKVGLNHRPGNDMNTYWSPAMKEAMTECSEEGQRLFELNPPKSMQSGIRKQRGFGHGGQSGLKLSTASEHDAADTSSHLEAQRNRLHIERCRAKAWSKKDLISDSKLKDLLELPEGKKVKSYSQLRTYLCEYFSTLEGEERAAEDPLEYDPTLDTWVLKLDWMGQGFPKYSDLKGGNKPIPAARENIIFSSVRIGPHPPPPPPPALPAPPGVPAQGWPIPIGVPPAGSSGPSFGVPFPLPPDCGPSPYGVYPPPIYPTGGFPFQQQLPPYYPQGSAPRHYPHHMLYGYPPEYYHGHRDFDYASRYRQQRFAWGEGMRKDERGEWIAYEAEYEIPYPADPY